LELLHNSLLTVIVLIAYAYLDTSFPPLVACTECIELSDPAPDLDTGLKKASAHSVSGRVVSRQAEEKIPGKHTIKQGLLDKNELCNNSIIPNTRR
jgi:hypothetical protein